MSDATTHSITCPGCQKRYRWKAELAGRKVRCGCGQVLRMPETDPAAEPSMSVDDGGYELNLSPDVMPQAMVAHGGQCPNCNIAMSEGAVLCLNCGFNLAQGTVVTPKIDDSDLPDEERLLRLQRRAQRDQEMAEEVIKEAHWVDVKLPILLIIIGALITAVRGWFIEEGGVVETVVFTLVSLGLRAFVMVPLLLVCVYIAARLMDIGFGTVQSTILKLAAIVIGPMAIADFIAFFIASISWGIGGMFVYGGLHFILTGSALAKLFDLDYFETAVLLIIFMLLNMFTKRVFADDASHALLKRYNRQRR